MVASIWRRKGNPVLAAWGFGFRELPAADEDYSPLTTTILHPKSKPIQTLNTYGSLVEPQTAKPKPYTPAYTPKPQNPETQAQTQKKTKIRKSYPPKPQKPFKPLET